MARTEYSVTIHTVRLFLHAYWALKGLTFAASSGGLPGLLINLEKSNMRVGDWQHYGLIKASPPPRRI